MTRKLTLSPQLVLAGAMLLLAGELVSGTSLYFACVASLAVLFAGFTYNVLGGLGSMSGIAFTRFALSTLVVAQVGKVLVLEKADQNLDTPEVVISVYALYFFSLMVGTMLFSRVRLPLPKPAEPQTPTQSKYLYVVTLTGGFTGVALGYLAWSRGEAGAASLEHGISLILAYLLPFSLVLAVDHRIRSTEGRHSLSWMALWPALAMEVNGFLWASRQAFVEPIAVFFLACYLRGFRFRKRHIVAAAGLAVFFFLFVSPFYLYSRFGREQPTASELAGTMIQTLEAAPSEWSTIKYQVGNSAMENTGAVNYFSSPGAVTLNRFALIGPDSTLISACSTGFHYAFTSLELDLLSEIPRALYRNKPLYGSGQYLGQLDGQEAGFETTTHSTITPIADSYGGFSWLGVVVFGSIAMPLVFVVFESMFDVRRPWGTIAALYLLIGLTEGSMGVILFSAMIKDPLYILALSWGTAWIVRLVPARPDRALTTRAFQRAPVIPGGQ